MEFINVPMNDCAQEQHWQGEIQGQFVQAGFQGQVLGEILDDENMQNWGEEQGNLEGEFPGNVEAAQYWGAGAGELQGELDGAPWGLGEDDHVQNVPFAEDDGKMPPLEEFDGIQMPMPIPIPVAIPEFAAEDPAVYNDDWQVPMPASGVLTVPQTPMNWVGLDFPSTGDPMGMSMAPPVAPTSMAMAPPMAPAMYPMTPAMGPATYTMAPPTEPMGYMVTTVVTPLTPAMVPLTPATVPLTPAIAALTPAINPLGSMAVPPAGQVYQLVGDNYSGLAVIPADMVVRRVF